MITSGYSDAIAAGVVMVPVVIAGAVVVISGAAVVIATVAVMAANAAVVICVPTVGSEGVSVPQVDVTGIHATTRLRLVVVVAATAAAAVGGGAVMRSRDDG